jgi:hypothetical protein
LKSLLVVAAPTLDLIDSKGPRPGGPGFYAALAGAFSGCRVDVLGPLGIEDAHLIEPAYSNVGARLLGPRVPGCSYRFTHTYKGGSRYSRATCMPAPLGPGEVESILSAGYDAILVSPVGCEAGEDVARLVAHSSPWIPKAVDVQGFVRCGKHIPWSAFSGYAFIHASSDDMQPPLNPPPHLSVVYTMGVRGGFVLRAGRTATLPDPPIRLGDPTGAGDVFTTLTLCGIARGLTLEEAVEAAVDATPRVLGAAGRAAADPTSAL